MCVIRQFKSLKALYIALSVTLMAAYLAGCATPHVAIDPPIRPSFSTYSEALWASLPTEAMENIVADDLACKRYILSTEERLRIHNAQ